MTIEPFAELPLALFSALMPLSVGSIIAWCIASLSLPKGAGRAAELRIVAFPLIIALVAFVAAFFHLTAPLNALHVLSGIGRSPLSTEVAAAGLYFAGVAVYAVLAAADKAPTCRQVILVVDAVLGVLTCVLIGCAYYVETIVGWASVWPAIEMVGYALAGGMVGQLVLSAAHCAVSDRVRLTIMALVVVGCVVAAFANGAHLFQVAGIVGANYDGSAFAFAALPYALGALAAAVVGIAVFAVVHVKRGGAIGYAVACVVLFVGVLLARLSFYCLQVGVGL